MSAVILIFLISIHDSDLESCPWTFDTCYMCVKWIQLFTQVERRLSRQSVIEQPLRSFLAVPDGIPEESIAKINELLETVAREVRFLHNFRELCKCVRGFSGEDLKAEVTEKGSFNSLLGDDGFLLCQRLMGDHKTLNDVLQCMSHKLHDVSWQLCFSYRLIPIRFFCHVPQTYHLLTTYNLDCIL